MPPDMEEEDTGASEDWVIHNEFATVRVRLIHTRSGTRLQISSVKLGYTVELDALELESLSWQQPAFFSRLLAHPLGPDGPDGDDGSSGAENG